MNRGKPARSALSGGINRLDDPPRWIVIAWVEEVRVWDGEDYAVDLGASAKFNTERKPRVVVWLKRGHLDDLDKARAHAEAHHPTGKAFSYTSLERDPLGRARREILL